MTKNLYPDKKRLLMDAALDVFSEKGFWSTKISDIVQKADLAQGTFYLYFKNKEHLFKEMLLSLHYEFSEDLDSIFSEPQKNLCSILAKKMIINFFERKKIIKVFLYEVLSLGAEFSDLYYFFRENSLKYFEKAVKIDYPSLNESTVKKKAFILGALLKAILDFYILREEKSFEEVIDIFLEYMQEVLSK
ncbi:MAG: TetR/AcrR family transcriptional regulator [Calditerrivibrio sp.]|nr:TetR/AcrR family transcriptional regulator [Calditerrivibrio sp.]